MRLGLYGDGIFRYNSKNEVIDGFMLNNPKDEYINNDGRLEKLERKNLLNKNGLGSLPDQNMFHKKDMNQSDSKVDQLMIHHNEVENILSDNIDEDTD